MSRGGYWVIALAALATGCPDSTVTDAGLDARVATDAGRLPPRCGDDTLDEAEVCDDGNVTAGDGCNEDCSSDESCGNAILDPGERCDDGNTRSGDGCGAACASDEGCGNGVVDLGLGERCDDGNTAAGDGCSADCTSEEACGNGVLDPSEACDDGNLHDGDGCDGQCRVESCAAPADCDDGDPCNGVESCAAGVCGPGAPLADGDTCDADMSPATRNLCIAGACAPSACGDRFLDPGASPPEACDDGDTMDGDGCDGSCQLESCAVDDDCDDLNSCTAGHLCVGGTCALGAAVPDGADCDADMMPETRDICLAGFCGLAACGDGFNDRPGGEECDDGNAVAGDGCEPDCRLTVPPTAFRVVSATLLDPHIYGAIGPRCQDITDAANRLLADAIARLELNLVGLFLPLDPLAASTPLEASFNADCMVAGGVDQCRVFPGSGGSVPARADNTLPVSMTCHEPVSGSLNPTYGGIVNRPNGPCFTTPELEFTINLGGIPIRLVGGRLSATYGGGLPPTRLVNGLLAGFVSLAEARSARFDAAIPVLGGDTLYEHLADGGQSGSACAGMGFSTDDSDTRDGGAGFWFYVNFEAAPVLVVR